MTITKTEKEGIVVVPPPPEHDTPEQIEPHEPLLLPGWVDRLSPGWGTPMNVDEWAEDGGVYRAKNGWKGNDLMHDVHSPVRILEYYVRYGTATPLPGLARGGAGTTLTGIVRFTPRAESHPGFCHGGSMTSVLDDVIGWIGFLVTGKCLPWSGYTVQINTSLQRPIKVGALLVVQARITKVVRRKVSVEAVLWDPAEEATPGDDDDESSDSPSSCCYYKGTKGIHATAEGLVVVNKGILPPEYDRSSSVLSSQSSSVSQSSQS